MKRGADTRSSYLHIELIGKYFDLAKALEIMMVFLRFEFILLVFTKFLKLFFFDPDGQNDPMGHLQKRK